MNATASHSRRTPIETVDPVCTKEGFGGGIVPNISIWGMQECTRLASQHLTPYTTLTQSESVGTDALPNMEMSVFSQKL